MKTSLLVVFSLFFVCIPSVHVCVEKAQASVIEFKTVQNTVNLSQLTPKERAWFRQFHEGNFFADGWHDISSQILAQMPANKLDAQRAVMEELGNKIGLEWCKDNAVRRVDTKMLKEWGGQLKKTAKTNPEQLPEIIASINSQVDDTLNSELLTSMEYNLTPHY